MLRNDLANLRSLFHRCTWKMVEFPWMLTQLHFLKKPFTSSAVGMKIKPIGAKRLVINFSSSSAPCCKSMALHHIVLYIWLPVFQIGWIYGSVTEDILTGFKMHVRGWRSIYCMPSRPAFKGSAPINLTDRLHQVLRWALGSVEIFLSRHCPIWYGYGSGLKWLERLAYINTIVYPWTSLPLLAYCTLPAVCLLTGKFIIPTVRINHSATWCLFHVWSDDH